MNKDNEVIAVQAVSTSFFHMQFAGRLDNKRCALGSWSVECYPCLRNCECMCVLCVHLCLLKFVVGLGSTVLCDVRLCILHHDNSTSAYHECLAAGRTSRNMIGLQQNSVQSTGEHLAGSFSDIFQTLSFFTRVQRVFTDCCNPCAASAEKHRLVALVETNCASCLEMPASSTTFGQVGRVNEE